MATPMFNVNRVQPRLRRHRSNSQEHDLLRITAAAWAARSVEGSDSSFKSGAWKDSGKRYSTRPSTYSKLPL